MSAIFQIEINCGECEYKTKVRTNMFRHLQMHKQNRETSSTSDGISKVCSVDPVNPVPCLNSNERFFDKMTNLASSSLIPSSTSTPGSSNSNSSNTKKIAIKIPYKFIPDSKRFICGNHRSPDCNSISTSEDLFRRHLSIVHSSDSSYRCLFCKEEICKRIIAVERIINHLRFHGSTIYRCEECNYVHYHRYVVERHINEKHATLKVNIIIHTRTSEDNEAMDDIKTIPFAGKKYKDNMGQTSNFETSIPAFAIPNNSGGKGKGKWICDVCGHKASNVNQIQSHCQQQHGVKNQYKCAHCNFGSQQLSQILHHIDEKHSGKTREARYMYHKVISTNEEVAADTRPLWQRNDPTRIRHIRGILMEDEEESEQYRRKLGLTDETDDVVDNTDGEINTEDNQNDAAGPQKNNDETDVVIRDFEFGCFHCEYKTQIFEVLQSVHHAHVHNSNAEVAKPFWFRLQRRFCCPDCRSFVGNFLELPRHIQRVHNKNQFYAGDISMAKNKDSSQRITCGYCSFNCISVELLYRHHLKMQHLAKDVRIDDDRQLGEMLELGKEEFSYQCTLCYDIFPNRVAIVQHACNSHAGDSFSFRSLKADCIYRCSYCQFTSTEEKLALTHMIDHYGRFTTCVFCREPQSSFNVCMQHCYAEHRAEIQKFKAIFSIMEIRKYLMQLLVIFRNGLVLTKRNLLNTSYGNLNLIKEVYDEMYRISQQPPIPRLSIARLVARKSIEAQQKQHDTPLAILQQSESLEALQTQSKAKSISNRRSTVAVSQEDYKASMANTQTNAVIEYQPPSAISKRRTTIYHDNPTSMLQHQTREINAPLQQAKKISKRRCTVAVDRDTLFSTNLTNSSSNSLLIERDLSNKRRKITHTTSLQNSSEFTTTVTTLYPLNLDMEPFSFYGKKPEAVDLTKIYTKVVFGGINTPLTIDKFKLLFNIDCQLKLTKCDEDVNARTGQTLAYSDYKHIKKACPASQKLNYD